MQNYGFDGVDIDWFVLLTARISASCRKLTALQGVSGCIRAKWETGGLQELCIIS